MRSVRRPQNRLRVEWNGNATFYLLPFIICKLVMYKQDESRRLRQGGLVAHSATEHYDTVLRQTELGRGLGTVVVKCCRCCDNQYKQV